MAQYRSRLVYNSMHNRAALALVCIIVVVYSIGRIVVGYSIGRQTIQNYALPISTQTSTSTQSQIWPVVIPLYNNLAIYAEQYQLQAHCQYMHHIYLSTYLQVHHLWANYTRHQLTYDQLFTSLYNRTTPINYQTLLHYYTTFTAVYAHAKSNILRSIQQLNGTHSCLFDPSYYQQTMRTSAQIIAHMQHMHYTHVMGQLAHYRSMVENETRDCINVQLYRDTHFNQSIVRSLAQTLPSAPSHQLRNAMFMHAYCSFYDARSYYLSTSQTFYTHCHTLISKLTHLYSQYSQYSYSGQSYIQQISNSISRIANLTQVLHEIISHAPMLGQDSFYLINHKEYPLHTRQYNQYYAHTIIPALNKLSHFLTSTLNTKAQHNYQFTSDTLSNGQFNIHAKLAHILSYFNTIAHNYKLFIINFKRSAFMQQHHTQPQYQPHTP